MAEMGILLERRTRFGSFLNARLELPASRMEIADALQRVKSEEADDYDITFSSSSVVFELPQQGNVYADYVIRNYYDFQSRVRANASLNAALSSMRLLGHLARIMKNRLDEEDRRDGDRGIIDKKLRRQIEEKKQAHGLKMGG
jgi:hypothetical protein